jgi:hypothetical protein
MDSGGWLAIPPLLKYLRRENAQSERKFCMAKNDEHLTIGDQGVLNVPGNYQPVHLEDTFGAILLGVFAVISLIGWMRAEARCRALLNQKGVSNGNSLLNA